MNASLPVIVEALKPPESDMDDETREALEELSQSSGMLFESGIVGKANSAVSQSDEPIKKGEPSGAAEGVRPQKKRRRS